ncbi:nitrate- and nitrite sensing domain-containing protein [uncultured Marinobacter sp.]|uniref:nitrate- and nitrite sensing domain-containing protein n=1 Tax=uncultured Marinobacter sp. TaxID=187379 RepID=UPI0030DC9F34
MNALSTTPVPKPMPKATDFLIASKKCELANLERFLQMGKLVLSIGNLIHTLQRERGASNVYLGSAGQRFSEELIQLTQETRDRQQVFEDDLEALYETLIASPASSRLLNSLAAALHGLDTLNPIRLRVRGQQIPATEAIDAYIERVGHLIAVVFEAAETVVDPTIAGILVAMVNLIQGKEMAGQERATGSLGFSRGQFDDALSQRITHLIDAQDRYFDVFTRFADADSVALWKHSSRAPYWEEIRHLRGLACSIGRYKPLDPALADQWFRLMTERIDHLKSVEDSLEEHFHRCCIERYTAARNALAHEETLAAGLDESGHAPEPVLLVCNDTSASGATRNYDNQGIGPRFGRSVFDLVQQQAQRLEQLNEELHAAREALEDRRTLEKAVLMLMKHQQISNDEAHKLLRKLAMDQGRKLTDVARSLLTMTDLLSAR